MIADSLSRFESVVKSLSPDEKKELVQMIVREISAKPFDPSLDQAPRESSAFSTRIRAEWILVNVSLFASDLLPKDWNRSGSAGAAKIRTCWDLSLTVSIPFSRWGAKPFVVHPLPFPTHILEDRAPATEGRSQAQEPRMHPFLLAQSWRQEMEHDTGLNKARIAAREAISRASVTQVMNLLQLPAEIQASLLRPPARLYIHSFSERRLRALVSFGDKETQTARWRELVQELKGSAGN
jgi:hypothetical protein